MKIFNLLIVIYCLDVSICHASSSCESAKVLSELQESGRCIQDAIKEPKTIADIQPFAKKKLIQLSDGSTVELVNMNTNINSSYILTFKSKNGRSKSYHLELPESPSDTQMDIDQKGLHLGDGAVCFRWDKSKPDKNLKKQTADSKKAYIPICNNKMYLLNPNGQAADESLKSKLSSTIAQSGYGRSFSNWIKNSGFGYTKEPVQLEKDSSRAPDGVNVLEAAKIDGKNSALDIDSSNIDIKLKGNPRYLKMGHWYSSAADPDVLVSVMTPKHVSSSVAKVNPGVLSKSENDSLGYFMAFDTSKVQLNYAVGTSDPTPAPCMFANNSPDGIETARPIVGTGLVPPHHLRSLVTTFNAGYQRRDSCMPKGPLSQVNDKSHWVFVQKGVTFSKLNPGLATMVTYTDGSVDIIEWPQDDSKLLGKVKDARQNITMLVNGKDAKKGIGIPDKTTGGKDFYAENWSVSDETDIRMRSGACILEKDDQRYLVYGFMPAATVGDMAQTFSSYGCSRAMQLDENLIRAGHAPLYAPSGKTAKPKEFLHKASNTPDLVGIDGYQKMIDDPDYRDFFYLTRKK